MSEEKKGFRRFQDWAQLIVSLGAIGGWGLTYYKDHVQMSDKLDSLAQSQRHFEEKYVPVIENDNKAIAVIRDQLEDIKDSQERIERKVDSRYSFR